MSEMSKNTKGLIAVLVVGVIAYFVFRTSKGKPDSFLVVSRFLDSTFGYDATHSVDNLKRNFEKSFVEMWSQAIMDGQSKFTFNGNQYNTLGGTIVK